MYGYWVIQQYNFMFCFPNFSAESPELIICVDECKVIENDKQEIYTSIFSDAPILSSEKLFRKTKIIFKPGKCKFYLDDSQYLYEISADNDNYLEMWKDSIRSAIMWYSK